MQRPVHGDSVAVESRTNSKWSRIFAGHYPCEEHDGYVWVYMTPKDAPRLAEAPLAAPSSPAFSDKYKIMHLSCEIPAHVDQGIIGLMDPAHGPFVHQSWYWRSAHSIHEKQKNFEPIPNGFRMSTHSPSANSAPYKLLRNFSGEARIRRSILCCRICAWKRFAAGNLWFSSRATVTPVRRDLSPDRFCGGVEFSAWVPGVVPIFRAFAKRFLRQDQETMIQQAEGLKHDPRLMLIDDADRPAKMVFRVEAKFAGVARDRVAGGAPDERASDAALAS